MTDNKEYRAWELMDSIIVDLSALQDESANQIIKEVYSYKDDDGFFEVQFIYGGKTLRPGLRVENIPVDEISDKIVSLEQKDNTNVG